VFPELSIIALGATTRYGSKLLFHLSLPHCNLLYDVASYSIKKRGMVLVVNLGIRIQ